MPKKNPLDTLAIALATGLGVGFVPVGPGTAGSLVGVVIAWLIIDRLKFSPGRSLDSYRRGWRDHTCGRNLGFVTGREGVRSKRRGTDRNR